MAANHSTIILSQNPEEAEERQQEKEDYGVLLYYKYFNTPIPDLQHLLDFYNSNCNSLSLLGRVRLSPTGVNVTVCSFFVY